MLSLNSKVVIAQPQLHNETSVLLEGQLVEINGEMGTVALDSYSNIEVPLRHISAALDVFGDNPTGRPNEMPVIDAIRR